MKTPTQLMNEALTDYHNGANDYSHEKIDSLKLAFKNELKFLTNTYGINGFDKSEDFDILILNRRNNLKQAIKLAKGIQ